MLATAKNYADADDTEKLINEYLGRAPRSDHPCRDDYSDNRGQNDNRGRDDNHGRDDNRDRRFNRDSRHNNRNKGKRVRDDDDGESTPSSKPVDHMTTQRSTIQP